MNAIFTIIDYIMRYFFLHDIRTFPLIFHIISKLFLFFSVSFIREELTDKDRMGVITFETSSVNVHPLLRMNAANIAATEQSIASLRPGGGTKILCGLEAAYKMLAARQTKNPISSVFLLTDGIDGSDLKQKKVSEDV